MRNDDRSPAKYSLQVLQKQLARVKAEVDELGAVLANSDPSLPPEEVTADWIRGILRARRRREEIFGASLFSDPGWDMLLALYAVDLAKEQVSITDLSKATAVPGTTLLRWIDELEEAGLIRRIPDSRDGRRIFIYLSSRGRSAMWRFFDKAHVTDVPV
jgi:DNA-binding MarR family transcriptional regulator